MVSKREKDKKHPKFRRTNYGRSKRKRIKPNWRRPRGTDNKQKKKIFHKGRIPNIGYGTPAEFRHLHPTGKRELLVHNPSQVIEAKNVLIRISAKVGKRKKKEIVKAAEKAGLRVLNPKV